MPFEVEMAKSAAGVLYHEGKILIIKRRPTAKIDANKWEVPKGKVRLHEEDPKKTIEREFLEETGIKVKAGPLIHTEKLSILGFSITLLVYKVEPLTYPIKVQLSHEHTDFAWIGPEDLDKYTLAMGMRGTLEKAFRLFQGQKTVKPDTKTRKGSILSLGKIPISLLEKMVQLRGVPQLGVLEYPGIGRDCFVADYFQAIKKAQEFYHSNDNCHLVVKADPITFPTPNPGRYAIVVNANDVATTGAIPYGITTTLLFPPNTAENEVIQIQEQLHKTSEELGIMVLGGHSEVSESLNHIVISASMIGFVPNDYYVNKKVTEKDSIYMLGYVGTEGTGIIASELEQKEITLTATQNTTSQTPKIDSKMLTRAKKLGEQIAIVQPLLQLNREFKLKQAHDATEGGVFGALWEFSQRLNIGLEIDDTLFPVDPSTAYFKELLGIDINKLISSGVVFFIGEPGIADTLTKGQIDGKPLVEIGKISPERKGVYLTTTHSYLTPPQADELIIALEKIAALQVENK